MIERSMRVVAILASALVAFSFGWFAIDELNGASARNEAQLSSDLGSSAPASRSSTPADSGPGGLRSAIDDASDALVSPFKGVVASDSSSWVRRGVPPLLALLVYGLGLGFLARYVRGRAWYTC